MSVDPPGDRTVHETVPEPEIDLRARSRDERFSLLQPVTVGLAQALTFESVCDVLMGHGLEAMGAEAGALAFLTGSRTDLKLERASGYPEAVISQLISLPMNQNNPFATCVHTGRPVVIESIATYGKAMRRWTELAHQTGHGALVAVPIRDQRDVVGVLALGFSRARRFHPSDLDFYRLIVEHLEASIERAHLISTVHAATREAQLARREAETIRDRLSFLVALGRSVSTTLDHTEVLQKVIELAVPRIADAGMALLPEAENLRRIAVAHRDPKAHRLAQRFVLGTDLPVDSPSPVALCFRTGEVQVQRFLQESDLENAPEYLRESVLSYGLRCWLCVPIRAAHEVLGVLALAFTDPDHLDDEETVALAVEIAGRTASGLINSELFEHQRDVALSLQETVLPRTLPAIAGFDVAAQYLPAETGMQIGGDWYDAFELADGRIGITVGDISGHGLKAGALMGQLRNGLRAYAIEGDRPAVVIQKLDRLLHLSSPDEYATVFYSILDPATGDLTWASAGHPPIVWLSGEDAHVLNHPRGVLLGAAPHLHQPEGQLVLESGDSVVIYTDGLIERRDEHFDDSLGDLIDRLQQVENRSAEALCRAAVARPTATRFDDLCVVALNRS